MEKQDIFIALGQALFSMFGACVKWINIGNKRHRTLFGLLAEVISAAFLGILVYLVYKWMDLNPYLMFAIAGILGNQGARAIDIFAKIIIKNSALLTVEEDEAPKPETSKPSPSQTRRVRKHCKQSSEMTDDDSPNDDTTNKDVEEP